MRYAKVKNLKVIHVVSGNKPEGYRDVVIKWKLPEEYPIEFYSRSPNKPLVTIEGLELHENWYFMLSSIAMVKDAIYDKQKKIRQKKQLGDFKINGDTVTLRRRSDYLDIKTLSETNGNYKNKKGKWIKSGKVKKLKEAAQNHVQAAYDWEMAGNEMVDAMTTYDELKTYFESL